MDTADVKLGQSLQRLSPAKLNLFLHITGRRADGYHLLQTYFLLLDYGDTLLFCLDEGADITLVDSVPGVAHGDNLIVRAARLLREQAARELPGVRIGLRKVLPMGGGLGGGSSNAATTLCALNELWQLDFSRDQLAALGLQLGADVPVFVRGQHAWAEGVGERLAALPWQAEGSEQGTGWFVVLHPAVEVPTAAVFGHPDLPRNTHPLAMPEDIRAFWQQQHNDCEALVCRLYPEIATARDWLDSELRGVSGGRKQLPARLTGTGACLFAMLPSQAAAEALVSRCPPPWSAFSSRAV